MLGWSRFQLAIAEQTSEFVAWELAADCGIAETDRSTAINRAQGMGLIKWVRGSAVLSTAVYLPVKAMVPVQS